MRLLLFVLILTRASSATCQIWESEPNDIPSQADAWPENTFIEGSYTAGQLVELPDVFRIIAPNDGKMVFTTHASVDDQDALSALELMISSDDADQQYECLWIESMMTDLEIFFNPAAGLNSFVTDSFEFHCAAQDTFYLWLRSWHPFTWTFDYDMKWEFIPASFEADAEPNGQVSEAIPLMEDSIALGRLYAPCTWPDEDIYRVVLPFAADQIMLYSEAESGDSTSDEMVFHILDASGVPLGTGSLGSGPFGTPSYDSSSIVLYAPDTIHIRVGRESSCGMAYALRYSLSPLSTGWREDVASVGMTIWPDPTSGSVRFTARGLPAGKAEITVFDASGQPVIRSERINIGKDHAGELDLSALPPGVYTVRLFMPERSLTERVVVVH